MSFILKSVSFIANLLPWFPPVTSCPCVILQMSSLIFLGIIIVLYFKILVHLLQSFCFRWHMQLDLLSFLYSSCTSRASDYFRGWIHVPLGVFALSLVMCPGEGPKALRGKKMSPGPESHTDSLSHLLPIGTLPVCVSGFTLEFQGEAALAGGRILQWDPTG